MAVGIDRAPVAIKVTAGAQQLLVDDNVFRQCTRYEIVYAHSDTPRAEEYNNTCDLNY